MIIIVLAAGLSSRMGIGENKLLLPYKDKPIIHSVLETALSFSDRIIVVTGHERERMEEAISGFNARPVYCPDYQEGQKRSTICGIKAAGDDDFAIVPGDLPLITYSDYAGTYALLSSHSISRAVYSGIPGHPVMFRKEHRQRLLGFNGSLREYLSMYDTGKYNGSIGTVLDADTPSRYKAIVSGNGDLSILH